MSKPNQKIVMVTLGLNMAVGMGIFTFIGYFIDQKKGSEPIGTLVGAFLGLFYCGYEVWKIIRRSNEQ